MKTYSFRDKPIVISGGFFEDDGRLVRMPSKVAEKVNETTFIRNYNPVGIRVRFRTDADKITVKYTLATLKIDWAIPLSGSAGADVFTGMDGNSKWMGVIAPKDYDSFDAEGTVYTHSSEMKDIVINLPRNEEVKELSVSIDDGAKIEAPSPYSITVPIVFYGSSITEGGCATAASSAYTSVVTRWLNADYINLGFSNAARGEQPMADYIAGLDMSAFVMDYDHNADNAEMLEITHERFFKTFRKSHPDTPVIIVTKPDFAGDPVNNGKRREVIRRTYDNAVASGDKKVWFVDGETFFAGYDRGLCTVEGCHPNDLGFMLMAKKIYPILKTALKID